MLQAAHPRVVIASDAHLGPQTGDDVPNGLASLLVEHPDAELVLAGDTFDLSLLPPGSEPAEAIAQLLRERKGLREALRQHLLSGCRVSLISGNHDATLASDEVGHAVRSVLEVNQSAPLELCPWFIRRGDVHIEHGHLYDPDNAPSHPLASWQAGTEPLGIALTRRFLVPSGATFFNHAHQTTPVRGLFDAFLNYRGRAPKVVYQYFHAAISVTLEARKNAALEPEQRLGEALLEQYAAQVAVPAGALQALLSRAPMPTHHHFARTFLRLYFDRILSSVSATAGAAAVASLSPTAAIALGMLGSSYIGWSVRHGSRYADAPVERLRLAARAVRGITDASHVVFGHTHHEEDEDGYVNTGSFAFSRREGMAYVVLDGTTTGRPRLERRVIPRASARPARVPQPG